MPTSKIRNLIIIIPIILTSGAVVLNYFCPLRLVHYKTDRARYGDIRALESAITLFRIDAKRLPTTEEGLNALTTKPANPPSNWRPYLDRLPKDPWGNDYIYKQEIHQEVDFVIYSKGPDGLDNHGAHDDVVNWKRDYSCELNYSCPSICEQARDVITIATVISYIILLVYLFHRVTSFLIKRVRA
jgi:type II secretion system protein G